MFNNDEFKDRNDMFFFVEMNDNLTGVLIGEHGRLMVAKSDLELVTGGS